MLPSGYPQMDFTEKMSYHGWDSQKSWTPSAGIPSGAICELLFPLGYFKMESTEEMTTIDGIKSQTKNCCHGGIGIYRTYCHSPFT